MKRVDFTELLIKHWNRYKANNKVTEHMITTVENIIFCRTEALGGHEYKCECGEVHVEWNSCHNKMCPTCSPMYEERWMEENEQNLPNVRYGHLVFSVPHELNWYWMGNKSDVTRILFDTVAEVIQEIYKYEYGITPGIKLYFHSWNSEQNIHLHIHAVLTVGGITENGKWKDISDKYIIPMEAVLIKYQAKLAYKIKGLRINNKLPKEVETVENIIKEKKVNIYLCDEYEGNAENIFRYLAKRMRGGIFKGIKYFEEGSRKIKLEYKRAGELKTKTIHVDELIKRFFYHIPIQGQKQVRNYGLFSSAKKKELEVVIAEKGTLKFDLNRKGKEVICEKCEKEMLPTKEVKSRKSEFIEMMIDKDVIIKGNKIRKISMNYEIKQLNLPMEIAC